MNLPFDPKVRARQALTALGALALTLAAVFVDRAEAAPGDHLQVGNATVTPRLDLGFEYRTNAYQTLNGQLGIGNALIVPALDVTTKGAQNDFRLGGFTQHRVSLVGGGENRSNLNRTDGVVTFDAALLKQEVLGFRISNDLGLRNNIGQANISETPFHTQFREDLLAQAVLKPSPVFEVSLGGRYAYDNFRVPLLTGTSRDFNQRNSYGPELEGKWTFFPRTAAVVNVSLKRNNWAFEEVGSRNPEGELGAAIAMPDSTHLKLTAGLRGRTTERLVVVLQAGYGLANYSATTGLEPIEDIDLGGLNRLLFNVQGEYFFDKTSRLTVGFRQDFEDSWFTNFIAYKRGYTDLNLRFGPRVGLVGGLSAQVENYEGEVVRRDLFFNARTDLAFYMTDWTSISAGAAYMTRSSNGDDQVGFQDMNVHVMMNVTY